MIEAALALSFPPKAAEDFRYLKPTIRRRAGERNNVVHCHWIAHDDYPDHLLHQLGLKDPELTVTKFSQKDFLEIQLRLAQLLLALMQFLAELPPCLDGEARLKSHWRPVETDPTEGDQGSPPGQKTDPSERPILPI